MNAPRAPVAFDLRTVESRAPRLDPGLGCQGTGALKPGAFYDAFKSTGTRPRWALSPPEATRSVTRRVPPAVRVRSRDIRWNDNAPGADWAAQRDRSVTERVAATEALRRADASWPGPWMDLQSGRLYSWDANTGEWVSLADGSRVKPLDAIRERNARFM